MTNLITTMKTKMYKFRAILIITLINLLISSSIFAQSPEKMSYQAVIRDADNNLITNSQVGMQISILQDSVSGTAVYVETQEPSTNANGLVSIEIGTGTTNDDFSAINWANGSYFIKTETDPAGGTSYTITNTSQLLSVPYALHAKTAETISGTITETQNLEDVLNNNNSAGYKNITNLKDPINTRDAVTKSYVTLNVSASGDTLFLGNDQYVVIPGISIANLDGHFVDSRDRTIYKYVTIGDQVWMAENLKYLPEVVKPDSGSTVNPLYYVYSYDSTDVPSAKATVRYNTFGVLYNWTAAMNGNESSSANPSGIQGACPPGWHLPSKAEWTELAGYLGGAIAAGGKLKDTTQWKSPNSTATNETGFTALPGGYRGTNGVFGTLKVGGYWWTSTKNSSNQIFISKLSYIDPALISGELNRGMGLSVRCVKD